MTCVHDTRGELVLPFQMVHRVLDLEELFEDQSIFDFTLNTFLALEQEIFEQRAPLQPLLSGAQTNTVRVQINLNDFGGFLELISRFEFEFRRCEN